MAEHCNFFKSIEDAKALRRRVSECFERAALPAVSRPRRGRGRRLPRFRLPARSLCAPAFPPQLCCKWQVLGTCHLHTHTQHINTPTLNHYHRQTPEDERKKLLSFIVVGGGPTGVEVAAELHDMIFDDLKDLYPTVIKVGLIDRRVWCA